MNKNWSFLWMLLFYIVAATTARAGDSLSLTQSSDPLRSWNWRNPLPQGNPLTAITYGNGKFVAVGNLGTVLTSSDGVSWTVQSSGPKQVISSLTFGNGKFVAVGNAGAILTSPDGVTWTTRSSGTQCQFSGITYGNGLFIAVGSGSAIVAGAGATSASCSILSSPDGASWVSQSSGATYPLFGVTFGNGKFVAVGIGSILTSSDGMTWTTQLWGAQYSLSAVTYGNGRFVAAGPGKVVTSPDGMTWTAKSTEIQYQLIRITYGNGQFVAVGNGSYATTTATPSTSGGSILTSPDGVTWTARSLGNQYGMSGVVYGSGKFVAVGAGGVSSEAVPLYPGSLNDVGAILTSSDGATWTDQTIGIKTDLNGVAYGDGIFVAVGGTSAVVTPAGAVSGTGTILTSHDGMAWTGQSPAGWTRLSGVTYGNGIFVVVGGTPTLITSTKTVPGTGTILTSPDGVTWTTQVSGNHYYLAMVTYRRGKFIAEGSNFSDGSHEILTSVDGITWTAQSSGAVDELFEVAYGNGIFVGAGGFLYGLGGILTSQDEVTWTARLFETSLALRGVTFGNGSFAAVGTDSSTYSGAILTSHDGVAWAVQPSRNFGVLSDVAYGNDTFVAVGANGTIIQSDPLSGNCAATLSGDMSLLHIPVLTYNGHAYRADLTNSADARGFTVTDAGIISDIAPFISCTPASLTADFKVHIPAFIFDGLSYWADGIYDPDTGLLSVTAFGRN